MLVIIPTYNEIDNIEKIIKAIFNQGSDYHILIVDDGSPDGTSAKVENLAELYPKRLFMIKRSKKMGLGTAYIAGFTWALQRKYEYIFEMDADFSHNPADLNRLLKACKDGADVAIGSRYCCGVNVVNWPMSRVLMSYYASVYVRFITRLNIFDATAGFVCYKRKVLETIDLSKIKFKGYAFQVEMKYTSYVLGFNLQEVSIIFINRVLGESKMNTGIFAEGIFGVLNLRLRKIFGKIKPRVIKHLDS